MAPKYDVVIRNTATNRTIVEQKNLDAIFVRGYLRNPMEYSLSQSDNILSSVGVGHTRSPRGMGLTEYLQMHIALSNSAENTLDPTPEDETLYSLVINYVAGDEFFFAREGMSEDVARIVLAETRAFSPKRIDALMITLVQGCTVKMDYTPEDGVPMVMRMTAHPA